MKSTIQRTNPTVTFPALMIHVEGEMIVFFERPSHGQVVHNCSDEGPTIGHYSHVWTMDDFIPFNGSVTIKN